MSRDSELTVIVDPEDRTVAVAREFRVVKVEPEDRTVVIPAELE